MDGRIATRCVRLNIVLEFDVFERILLTHLLRQSEVDKVERLGVLSEADHHIVWLYVAMHDAPFMHYLEL